MNTESIEFKEINETFNPPIDPPDDDKLEGSGVEFLNDSVHESPIENEVDVQVEDEIGLETPKKYFEKFLNEFKEITDIDKKLEFGIDFMEMSIAQTGTPHFKSFWEARTLCLELFKENISPPLRSICWAKYNDLSKEARRLKDMLDEQSSFAVEQIEIAIKDLETTIAEDHQFQQLQDIDFGLVDDLLTAHFLEYQEKQKHLNLLNIQASRINALRKELIRTEMRVRQKNKFFQRLSVAGDKVFPLRKDLIKQISDQFIADINAFIENDFKNSEKVQTLSQLREKIKCLQNVAKLLTLNTQAFTYTRMHLSEAWDRLKHEEKTRKKERMEQRATHQQNYDAAIERLNSFKDAYDHNKVSLNEAKVEVDAMGVEFCQLDLGRVLQNELRQEFVATRQLLADRTHLEENSRLEKQHVKENEQRQKIQDLKLRIEALIKKSSEIELDTLISEKDEIITLLQSLSLNKIDKNECDRQLKLLKDRIAEKKEQSLICLSDDDRQSLHNLKDVLNQRKERRQSIKQTIEQYRKSSSHSGLDFEQAMNDNLRVAEEKERLEKITQSIKEVEQKIAELEKKSVD